MQMIFIYLRGSSLTVAQSCQIRSRINNPATVCLSAINHFIQWCDVRNHANRDFDQQISILQKLCLVSFSETYNMDLI